MRTRVSASVPVRIGSPRVKISHTTHPEEDKISESDFQEDEGFFFFLIAVQLLLSFPSGASGK